MNLSHALRIADRAVIAFVGGGGKTTALYRLVAELAEPGVGRVLTAPTTKMFMPQPGEVDGLFVHPDFDTVAARLEATIPYLRRIAIAPNVIEAADGWKLDSVPLDWPKRLTTLPRVAAVVIEADGSKHLSFKAPAAHEPPIPQDVDLVIIVAGMDILGQPLDAAHVHRPERVAALTGLASGAEITTEVVASVLSHPDGGLKNVPPQARLVALLNKVDGSNLDAARDLAGRLLAESRYEAVLLGAVPGKDPVRERHTRLGAVVLAAGGARRFGAAKQTLPWQGTTLVGHALELARASGASETVLVTGAHAAEVRQAVREWGLSTRQWKRRPSSEEIDGLLQSLITIRHNHEWQTGLSQSVRAGLRGLSEGIQAALFLLADQPTVTPSMVQALVQRYRETAAPIVVPTFEGRRGTPTLFDRALWPELLEVTGDKGGRVLIEKYRERVEFVEVGEAVAVDVDTPEDYDRLMRGA